MKQQGTSAAYIKARLRRNHQEIAKQLEAGKFTPSRRRWQPALLIENFSPHRLDASNDVPVRCLGNHQQDADVEEHHHQLDAPRRNSFA